jgi:hypothetical protein
MMNEIQTESIETNDHDALSQLDAHIPDTALEAALDAAAEGTNSPDELPEASLDDGFQFSDEPTPDEAAAMSSDGDDSAKTGAVEATEGKGSAGGDKLKPAPAYEAFVAAVKAHGIALGLAVKEQKGFFQFRRPATDQRLYIAKQGRGVTRIDTTLPRSALTVNGKDISLPLTKENGKIECHVDPTVESVTEALTILAGYDVKVRSAKAPVKQGAAA